MTRHSHLDPSPFFLEGGPVGVLLIHGFTGSPPEMRLIGDYLHQQGLTVSGPLLPGHGTTVEEMNRCRWSDWSGHVEQALADLQVCCETVFVGGLSMGSLLALYLAAHHAGLGGAILYSPAVLVADRLIYLTPLLKYVVRKKPKSGDSDLTDPKADLRLWSYEENPVFAAHELLKLLLRIRRLLPRVTCPLLIIHSTLDQAIHPNSALTTYERVGSLDKELVTLHNSGHCITVDSEWETVAEKTYCFILDHLPAGMLAEG
ncbi:MAG TPA: alpha/beta fold hydrolase [Anaerolineae bacterium]|nr:alpha/beta fold hydrolase [Anaerolineae bacterium]